MVSVKFVALLILNIAFAFCVIGVAGAQTEYSIDVADVTWDRTDLSVLVVTQEGEAWWNDAVVDLTLQALDMWNDAFVTFASEYPDFAYVSSIRLDATVSAERLDGFDVYITWVDSLRGDNFEATVGRTQLFTQSGLIVRSDIVLAVRDAFELPLTRAVMQSIAAHEVGHALGLYHTAHSADLMYERVSLDISVRPISTLNAYGVAQVFRWRAVSLNFDSVNQGSGSGSVVLPSGVEYRYLNEQSQNQLVRIISSFLQWIQTERGLIEATAALFVIMGIVIIVSTIGWFVRKGRR